MAKKGTSCSPRSYEVNLVPPRPHLVPTSCETVPETVPPHLHEEAVNLAFHLVRTSSARGSNQIQPGRQKETRAHLVRTRLTWFHLVRTSFPPRARPFRRLPHLICTRKRLLRFRLVPHLVRASCLTNIRNGGNQAES